MSDFTGKVAVVTGGGKGIGAATVRLLLASGAQVAAGSRHATADLAEADGLLALDVDLASASGPGELVGAAVETFGGVDVLVNNVGRSTMRLGGFETLTDTDWQEELDLNFFSAVRATQAVLPSMTERGGGSIVTVASTLGWVPHQTVIPYAAAKAALLNLCKALASELGPKNIRVNTVSPGLIRTPLWVGPDGIGPTLGAMMGIEDVDAALLASAGLFGGLPLGRLGTAEDVAELIAFLAGPRAAYITGSDVIVDGGLLKNI